MTVMVGSSLARDGCHARCVWRRSFGREWWSPHCVSTRDSAVCGLVFRWSLARSCHFVALSGAYDEFGGSHHAALASFSSKQTELLYARNASNIDLYKPQGM